MIPFGNWLFIIGFIGYGGYIVFALILYTLYKKKQQLSGLMDTVASVNKSEDSMKERMKEMGLVRPKENKKKE